MFKQHTIYFQIFIACSFVIQSCALQTKILFDNDLNSFSIVESCLEHTGTDAYIRKITDGQNIYILKQIRDSALDEQFLLVNDAIASTIGFEANINVNQVFFVPYNTAKNLKKYPERAATLHTYINGKNLAQEQPGFLTEDFTLQQLVINSDALWYKKYPFAINQQGFTKDIIETISFHEDLISIVALDTYIGNSDRSLPNIFYNQKNNHFYGIDQADAFSKKLPFFACERFQELIESGYFKTCGTKIIDSLKKYKNVLLFLKDTTLPSAVIQDMHKLASYLEPNSSQNNILQERLKFHELIIADNYKATEQLINLINQITCDVRKK